jgi:hypothetical protein
VLVTLHLQSVHDLVGYEVSTVNGFRVVGFDATCSDFEDVDVVLGFVPGSQVLNNHNRKQLFVFGIITLDYFSVTFSEIARPVITKPQIQYKIDRLLFIFISQEIPLEKHIVTFVISI